MRDLRDPQKLGEEILRLRERADKNAKAKAVPRMSTSRLMEQVGELYAPDYPQDETTGTLAAREYRAELEERKAAGDKYAASALEAINSGRRVVVDDPSGE